MTQTFTEGVTSLPPQEIQKQRRKQVRRQTRMMLKVEQAKRDVQRAQMKMAKAQVDREIAATRLRVYEEQLNQMRDEGSSQEGRTEGPNEDGKSAGRPRNRRRPSPNL
jgi:hypothetical protein